MAWYDTFYKIFNKNKSGDMGKSNNYPNTLRSKEKNNPGTCRQIDYSVIEPNTATSGSRIADVQKYLKSNNVRESMGELQDSGLLKRIKESNIS
jgi:hypothetical protein